MSEKQSLGHGRAVLLQTIMNRNLSEDIALRTSKIIKNTREMQGSEAADKKAEELTKLINDCKTEEEILKAINAML